MLGSDSVELPWARTHSFEEIFPTEFKPRKMYLKIAIFVYAVLIAPSLVESASIIAKRSDNHDPMVAEVNVLKTNKSEYFTIILLRVD